MIKNKINYTISSDNIDEMYLKLKKNAPVKNFNLVLKPSSINEKYISPYYKKHSGETAVILGTGITLNQYKPIKNAIHLGVNSIVDYEKINVDYYFVMDYSNGQTAFIKNQDKISKYNAKLQKFYGKSNGNVPLSWPTGWGRGIPDKFFDKTVKPFETVKFTGDFYVPPIDLGKYCFGLPISTIFMPIQFALYAGFQKIYLVGCDCEGPNFKYKNHVNTVGVGLKQTFVYLREFVKLIYPDVEIKVINPVGLKNIFPSY